MRQLLRRDGFSLTELVMVMGIIVILAAIAVPMFTVGRRARVDNGTSLVRETLQSARLRAVAVNKPLQVRFNCPTAGAFRIVQAGWSDTGRCDEATYPYPAAPDAAYQTPPKPRFDGPVQRVHSTVTLSASDPTLVLQFNPNGQVAKVTSGSATLLGLTSVSVTVSSNGYQKAINVNGLGKVVVQ